MKRDADKVYLSRYWLKSIWFIWLCAAVVVVIILAVSPEFDIGIGALISSLYILALLGWTTAVMRLLRYTVIENNRITAYSFFGKELCTINLYSPVYFDVISIAEGLYTMKQFGVISTRMFQPYRYIPQNRLVNLCKSVDATGEQIILPKELLDKIYNAGNFIYVN